MSQYDERVEQQRLKIAAEEWAQGVRSLHAHSLNSMWYDTRPEDTADGKGVVDTEYNNGLVKRQLSNGEVYLFSENELKGDALIQAYSQNN
tara:strand:- start:1762 stop:2034 length:273 start_codon:yes stop_codon:yes gene_type:complete